MPVSQPAIGKCEPHGSGGAPPPRAGRAGKPPRIARWRWRRGTPARRCGERGSCTCRSRRQYGSGLGSPGQRVPGFEAGPGRPRRGAPGARCSGRCRRHRPPAGRVAGVSDAAGHGRLRGATGVGDAAGPGAPPPVSPGLPPASSVTSPGRQHKRLVTGPQDAGPVIGRRAPRGSRSRGPGRRPAGAAIVCSVTFP